MISTTEFRNGAKLEVDGEPYVIVEFQHVKPGKGGAIVRTRLRSLKTGNVLDKTFRSGDRFETPDTEEKQMQFLYAQGDEFHFMDSQTYEQVALPADALGDARDFLKENTVISILFYKGKAIGVELPMFVEMRIIQTDPGFKGDTATGGTKLATIETGAIIKVPLYLAEGEVIKIDTRTRSFVERAK